MARFSTNTISISLPCRGFFFSTAGLLATEFGKTFPDVFFKSSVKLPKKILKDPD